MVSETLLMVAMTLAGVSGLPGLLRPREGRAAERLFVAFMTSAGLCAALGAAGALTFSWSADFVAGWQVPGGRMALRVDAISAMFVLPIAALSTLGAWYGLEYWPQRAHPFNGRKLRAFYGVVTAGLLLLVVARNAVLFLVGWELMALAAFMLVTTEDEKSNVRQVGFIYLVATRAGTLCLFAMFGLLAAASGTLDMAGWSSALASPLGNAIFLLALLGFGLKAGIMPLHVWLPGAHANAPSHISALMSGVLIKSGIYGLVRLTSLCEAPPLWWGYVLLGAGVISGMLGVGFAIGQHDLKRLLAYHSVENIGIICLGLGVAVLGRSLGHPELIALGIAGALLHVWNHALFKALLFLAAGAVIHATHTREIDRLGGLAQRMPLTSFAFLSGSAAICGLPPLNGLISEILIYLGLVRTGVEGASAWLVGALAAPALAFIGGLALACFTKVFGSVFLGIPRSSHVEHARESGPAMLLPMAILVGACLLIGLGAPLVAPILNAAVIAWSGSTARVPPGVEQLAPLLWVSTLSAALLLVLMLMAARFVLRLRALRGASAVGTWDCGYTMPTVRMQYTSSSFAAMLVAILGWALRPSVQASRQEGPFPVSAMFSSHVPDTVLDRVLLPSFARLGRWLERLRMIQRGNVHLYILYILGVLVVLLLWS